MQESAPVKGQDVKIDLVLRSEGSAARTLSVNINVQAMTYTGQPKGNIQNEVVQKQLLPGKGEFVHCD